MRLWFAKTPPPTVETIYQVADRNRRELLLGEQRAVRRMQTAWRQAERSIEARLKAIIAKIEEANAAGLAPSPAWVFQQARWTDYLDTVRMEIQRYGQVAGDVATAQQAKSVALGGQHAARILKAAQVHAGFVRVPKEQLQDLVGFLADGSPLKELFDKIGPAVAERARQVMTEEVAAGQHPRVIARRLRKETGIPAQRSLLITRTESIRAYRTAQLRNYQANDDVVTGWRWTSARDERTCPICIAMDGSEHPLDEVFGSHPACRCAPTPILRHLSVDRGTGEEWLRAQPESVQIEKLGRARYERWRDGKVSLRDLVEVTNHERWGPGKKLKPLRVLDEDAAKAAKVASRLTPNADPISARLFAEPVQVEYSAPISKVVDGSVVDVEQGPAPVLARIRNLFGRDLSRDEIADLCGAPGGAKVQVTLHSHGRAPAVKMESTHPDVGFSRRVYYRKGKSTYCHNDAMVLLKSVRGGGIGPRLFAKQVEAAMQAGVKAIDTYAARQPGFTDGYAVWPKLGYTSRLPKPVIAMLPDEWHGITKVQELLAAPGGPEWWAKYGTELPNALFDLSPDGYSVQTLNRYMNKKPIKFGGQSSDQASSEWFSPDDDAWFVSPEERSARYALLPRSSQKAIDKASRAMADLLALRK